jgi:CHAT domain
MAAPELEITVTDAKTASARTSSGKDLPGIAIDSDPLRRDTIAMIQRWLSEGTATSGGDLKVLGRHLYALLFTDRLGAFLDAELAGVHKGERLRLQLQFHNAAAELAAYPWEFLYHPTRMWFFATSVDLVLYRYLAINVERSESVIDEGHALRLLVVVSKPEGLGPVLEQPVLEAIEKVAEDHPVAIEVADVATVENILEKLDDVSPHVVHFIGHGRYNSATHRAEIALLDQDERTPLWFPDEPFSEFFPQTVIPRLVFLHLCESARSDASAAFAGFAPWLLQQGVQAVVAMQYPITNSAAIAFSRAFYREVAKGTPVDRAVQSGRWRITLSDPHAYDSRVFGTPVLYMRSRDGIIRPLAPAAPTVTTEVAGT